MPRGTLGNLSNSRRTFLETKKEKKDGWGIVQSTIKDIDSKFLTIKKKKLLKVKVHY